MHPYHAAYSIAHFSSFDNKSNEWRDEPILGDRPYDTSEFRVLPLYNDKIIDNDSSVIIWGGYGQVDLNNGPYADNVNEMKAVYGEEYHDFTFQYRKRLYGSTQILLCGNICAQRQLSYRKPNRLLQRLNAAKALSSY